jgi:hypothetical protein
MPYAHMTAHLYCDPQLVGLCEADLLQLYFAPGPAEETVVLVQTKRSEPAELKPLTSPGIEVYAPREGPALDDIHSEYECADRAEVEEFLRGRPAVLDFLREVPKKAHEFFGDEVTLGLAVVQDGEYFVAAELFVYVVTSLPQEAAWRCFLAMQDSWWVEEVPDESVNLDVRLA